ncbi:MAG: thiamine pyrophosphate-dependent enzyme [Lentisphaeria bacterium]|nr:thiamine pyrophosphate-dependent enzyme [Lentisphaeria bacterium]
MADNNRSLLSGNEAVARAALDAGVALGVGYPGTPSTEILETFAACGGKAQWSPNEKVALEVGIGVAFGGARALVTMKHVGVNVAADPLFTVAYSGCPGGLVIVTADDPGMASSQNEQDNRHYARAAGVPMFEPSDSQEAYDFTFAALALAEDFQTPVFLRLTTRICHSKTIVRRRAERRPENQAAFVRDVKSYVMIPAYARPAHVRMRARLAEIAHVSETSTVNRVDDGRPELGIITSGVAYMHAREACPSARILKLGLTYPLPIEKIRAFAESVDRCVVVEEGDPILVSDARSAGIAVEGKDEMYRFGELNVARVRRIIAGNTAPEPRPPAGKPPALCQGCPHRIAFQALKELDAIVSGDIGCYTLGVMPPFQSIDTCVCMGASIGVGLGLRHVLPAQQAKKVVSVIGDSTFIHSGLTGIAEMVYNPPRTGHVVVILDNATTAMTGLQEHPGTGRALNHEPARKMVLEDVIRAMGVEDVQVFNPHKEKDHVKTLFAEAMEREGLTVFIMRSPCVLAAKKIHQYDTANAAAAGE